MSTYSTLQGQLQARDTDVRLTDDLLGELELLSSLHRRPALYRFRNAVAMRRYRAGETVVRQGERGGSAFYVLTAADVLALLNGLCRAIRVRRPDPEVLAEREAVRQRVENPDPPDGVLRIIATRGPRLANPYEPYPGTLDPRYTKLHEGEIFGEAACLEGTPQPATIVALRDCYLLEMKADFLAAVQADPVQKDRADSTYRAHVLRLQLGRLPLFRDLTEGEFAPVREAVELHTVSPGDLIYQERERCDGLYMVRAGLVKLVKHATALLGLEDITDWPRLYELLRENGAGRSPRAALCRRLSASTRALLTREKRSRVPDLSDRAELLDSLNALIASADLLEEPELAPLADGGVLSSSEEQSRKANRLALEMVLGRSIRSLGDGRNPECVLTYCSRGDAFGLDDLLMNRPFSASAVALGHPNSLGRVELAWLPAPAFWQLLREVPRLREPLKQETARQRRNAERRLAVQPWDDPALQYSEEAAGMGLGQGQQLMLIDLDRCTRCDECVRACATSRDDGLSRVYLEGPRFGKYLVPTTCRACLDPVCLIGCPVGSIHRKPGQEIIIEDWCIGCGLCGESCPYGAIQLHDVGLIPESSANWRVLPVENIHGDGWRFPGFRATNWLQGSTPFILDRTLREHLSELGLRHDTRSFAFRIEFGLLDADLCQSEAYRLETVSAGDIRIWVNGCEVIPAGKPRGGRNSFAISGGASGLRAGSNVLAAEVTLPLGIAAGKEPLFQARLDTLLTQPSDEAPVAPSGRPVTRRAAVCDLCSSQQGGPICVNVCPHDAAMRVDARAGLPF